MNKPTEEEIMRVRYRIYGGHWCGRVVNGYAYEWPFDDQFTFITGPSWLDLMGGELVIGKIRAPLNKFTTQVISEKCEKLSAK